jgi:hypothetical protein
LDKFILQGAEEQTLDTVCVREHLIQYLAHSGLAVDGLL